MSRIRHGTCFSAADPQSRDGHAAIAKNSRLFINSLLGALLLLLPLLASGCAATCREVAGRRAALLQAKLPPSRWHAAVRVPHALLNRIIAERLPELPPYQLRLGGLLGPLLPPLVLRAQRLELRAAAADRVGFQLELGVSLASEPAFSLTADVSVAPRITSKHELEVAVRPADLESVKPVVDRGALDRLVGIIYRRFPAARMAPRQLVVEAAGAAITLLGSRLHSLLRATLLKRLGEVGHLRFALPAYLPVAELGFRAGEGSSSLLLIRTGLPVAQGLPEGPMQLASGGNSIRAILPGPAVAAVANWGMEKRLLPHRFDQSGRPQEDGAFEASLSWTPGARPLRITAWRLASPCAEVQVSGVPWLKVKAKEKDQEGAIEVGVREARVDEVHGSALVAASVWLRTLFKNTFELTRKLAAETRLTVAGAPLRLLAVEGGLQGELFWVGWESRPVPAAAPAPAPKPKAP